VISSALLLTHRDPGRRKPATCRGPCSRPSPVTVARSP